MRTVQGMDINLRFYQGEIISSVCKLIENGNRMQTVLLPNTGGKTMLSFILSIAFSEEGKTVLYYTDVEMTKSYAANSLGIDIKRLRGVDFGNPHNIRSLYNNNYDIVITDAIHSIYDYEVLRDFGNRIRQVNVNKTPCSQGEKHLIALHYLQEMIERDSSYVISFELNKIEEIGYVPIIDVPNVMAYKMSREAQLVYGLKCADEFDSVSKKKMQVISEHGTSGAAVKQLSDQQNFILEKLDNGLSAIEIKLDKLQEDVSQVLTIVRETNETVQSSKDVLSIYYSIHGVDDYEAELFTSKVLDKMTEELLGRFTNLENQKKYHCINKLVLTRLGENAWSKLNPESKKFLVTAKLMFIENMDMGDDVDYSSICLLSSKALEVELAKRFITGYERYLEDKGIEENHWPKGILIYNRRRNHYEKMHINDFALGNCPYIMGILGNENERHMNKQYFEDYCFERLLVPLNRSDIEVTNRKFDVYIRNIRNNYRNPAAHKSIVTMNEASECLDYILEVERVLKIMLEQFAF